MDEAKFEFGTEKNPIVLEKINTPRPLISRCVRFNPEARNSSELVSIDFGKFRGKKESYYSYDQIFLKNLLSNPYLSLNAFRLAIWLDIFVYPDVDDQHFFILRNNEDLPTVKRLYVGHPRGYPQAHDVRYFRELLPELRKMSILMPVTEVITALQELHDFQYITVTEINYENSYLGRKARKEREDLKNREQAKKQPIFLSEKCALVCIVFTRQLFEKNLSGKWAPMLNT